MRRIAVVGCGGAGKTRFAAELGQLLGLPVIHLDRFYWKPCWVPSTREGSGHSRQSWPRPTRGSWTGTTAGPWTCASPAPTQC